MHQLLRGLHENLFRIPSIPAVRGQQSDFHYQVLRTPSLSHRHLVEARVRGLAPLLLSRQAA
jgi:hypothetical protein